MLECLYLPHGLGHVSSDGRREDFVRLDYAVRINDEPAAVFDAGVLVVYTVGGSDLAARRRRASGKEPRP